MARPARTEQRRREIVERAAALFDDVGYEHVSMDDIAASVGLSKSTLYHYIERKHDLLYLINGALLGQLLERHEERMGLGMRAQHLLLEVMGDILEMMHRHRGHARVFFEHLQDLEPHQREEVEQLRGRYFRYVVDVIDAGVHSGEISTPDPQLTALGLFGMCSWSYTWYRPDGPMSARAVAYHFWAVLMEGLSNPGGSRE